MAYDKNNFDPKAAAEARKKEMDEITGKLEKGVKDIFSSDKYKAYLDFCAKLPRYSVNNQILIMMQKPEATMCQSFTGWKEMNRHVLKEEKGIRILAPSPYKMEREQDKLDKNGKAMETIDMPFRDLSQGINSWFFEDPLWATVTVTADGHITIKGRKTRWACGIDTEPGNPGLYERTMPCINDRDVQVW